jgi:hypothetical protein
MPADHQNTCPFFLSIEGTCVPASLTGGVRDYAWGNVIEWALWVTRGQSPWGRDLYTLPPSVTKTVMCRVTWKPCAEKEWVTSLREPSAKWHTCATLLPAWRKLHPLPPRVIWGLLLKQVCLHYLTRTCLRHMQFSLSVLGWTPSGC